MFPWLSWKYSLLLPTALILLAATFVVSAATQQDVVAIEVTDQTTGNTLEGAAVTVGDQTYLTNSEGRVMVERPSDGSELVVQNEGFRAVTGEWPASAEDVQRVSVQPSVLSGAVTDRGTGEPLAEAVITLADEAGDTIASVEADANGQYRFNNAPASGLVSVDAGVYGQLEEPIGDGQMLDFQLDRIEAAGRIFDASGEPLQGAVVGSGDIQTVTAGDGTFTLEGVANGAEVVVSASGFETEHSVVDDGRVADMELTTQHIKAVYANFNTFAEPGAFEELIEIANTTEINAIVVDIKQDWVFYDSQVEFFRDAGAVNPAYDAAEILQMMEDNGIYSIARLVVFQDPVVAEARPDLAVGDTNGGLWRNEQGTAWVNAFHEELWDANIELALEAAELGFDEIQYDYVRFPSDGDLSTADFGSHEYTAENRENAITEFMRRSYEAIQPTGTKFAADLFGWITMNDDEQYIGQRFSQLVPHMDYVNMMIYPSHYDEGNIAAAPGHPNDYPYETILEALERADELAPGNAAKFRPWLQDFDYGGLRAYEAEDVRAQIDAAEDFGASGWMLWGYDVTTEALAPQDD